jgi:hypothetical protein
LAASSRRHNNVCGDFRGLAQPVNLRPEIKASFEFTFAKFGRGEAFRAHVVSYADDFVILSRGCAAEALAWTKAVMTRLGLTLNEAKTSLRDARQERFTAGRTTFAMGRASQHSAMLTAIPTSACATSSQDGTKWQGTAPAGSLTELGLLRLERLPLAAASCALR